MTPTLSQVRNWDTEHLTAAADHWSRTATVWEDRFTQYATGVCNPGGTAWEGTAAQAAQQRAHCDRMTVIGLADQLHDASAIARSGAMKIAEACRLVLRSVDAAQQAGFTVGEDFSVTDHHVYNMRAAAARQAQAEGFAADLRAALTDLMAADADVATRIAAATTGLGANPFVESGGASGGREGVDGRAAIDQLRKNMASGDQSGGKPDPDSLLGYLATHPAPAPEPKEPFSWAPSPTDVATGVAAGMAGGSHDAVLQAAAKRAGPDDAVVRWTKELKVGDFELRGFSKAGGLMALATAPMGLATDYTEAREAGAGKSAAWGQAIAREGVAGAAGLYTGGLASAFMADVLAGAAIGSVVPGAGTAVGLVAGVVVGGFVAFGASKAVSWLFS